MNEDFLYGLLFSCPFDERLDNCPFTNIRRKTIFYRVEFFMLMSKENKEKYIRAHKKCLELRENKPIGPGQY
ncbi:MAG: hypothetical protein P1P88_19025 [Bacteroidales bacterium]|nr:hypothetical protein [Bacteroidales bacterium]